MESPLAKARSHDERRVYRLDGAVRGDQEQKVQDTGSRHGAHVPCCTRVTHRKMGTHCPADSSPREQMERWRAADDINSHWPAAAPPGVRRPGVLSDADCKISKLRGNHRPTRGLLG